MKASGTYSDAIIYGIIAGTYVLGKKTYMAEKIIGEMINNNVAPDEYSCSIIVSGYCKEGKMADAIRFIHKMKELGVQPNVVVFNPLFKGFLDARDADGVDEALKLMGEYGVKPDVITFGTIMNHWSSQGMIDKCHEIFDDMVKAGIEPDIPAFNILTKGYAHDGEIEKVESVLSSMRKYGLRLNTVIFSTIIGECCSTGNMEQAEIFYDKMRELGIYPDLNTYEALIRGYAEAKQPRKAQQYLQIMEEKGFSPEGYIKQAVADARRASGVSSETKRIYRRADQKTASYKKNEVLNGTLDDIDTKHSHYQLLIPGETSSSTTNTRNQQVVRSRSSFWTKTRGRSMFVTEVSVVRMQMWMKCRQQIGSPAIA